MKRILLKYLFLLPALALLPQMASAQLDNDYFAADQLLNQQKYEEAFEAFYELHQEDPSTYVYFEKATESLINLKEYEKAISITKEAIEKGINNIQTEIRLGEIYHISGETEEAYSLWEEILDRHPNRQQVHLRIARTLSDRQAFDRAVDIYQQMREKFASSNMITSELAGTYLQAGQYEEAIAEYLQLVKNDPERMNYVQQRLIRFQDDYIYDVAILEISGFLDDLSSSHPSYTNLQQLEVWLLMERDLHKRALVTAKNYESESPGLTYTLYNIGSKLRAAQKFELAEQAFSFYIDKGYSSVKFRSMEELANNYRQWARYLENYNLGLSSKRDSLYRQAVQRLNQIRNEAPDYQRMDQVLVTLAELSLDHFHEPDTASTYLDELRNLSDDNLDSQIAYIEGRLHLYDGSYTEARVAFTKANKRERTGSMAEKTRYYLALTDFYSGDYEFSKIQLNALKRQNTSYFANDAIQLNLWIQKGLQADSTGQQLDPFAKAVEYFSQGKHQLGKNELQDILANDNYHPLTDNAILELSKHKNSQNVLYVYRVLSEYLSEMGSSSPLHERMLWEKARIADQLVTNEDLNITATQSSTDSLNDKNQLTGNSQNALAEIKIPADTEEIVSIYEELLLNFPDGFYASFARERISELQNIQT